MRWALAWTAVLVTALSSTLIATSSSMRFALRGGHACAVEDEDFQTAEGGCRDLATGLVWGTRNMGHGGSGWGWRSASRLTSDSSEGGLDDWRLPTVAELQGVLANGAATHFAGGHDLDGGLIYWTADEADTKRLAVNSTTRAASEHLAESALYFIGVRVPPEPDGGG